MTIETYKNVIIGSGERGPFFTPTVVGSVNRILGHSVPRSYTISTDPFPNAEERAIRAMIDEMDAVGVRLGVMNGRHSVNRPVPSLRKSTLGGPLRASWYGAGVPALSSPAPKR